MGSDELAYTPPDTRSVSMALGLIALLTSATDAQLNPAASRKAWFMGVCHPGPSALKRATPSGPKRRETATFEFAAFGRPPALLRIFFAVGYRLALKLSLTRPHISS